MMNVTGNLDKTASRRKWIRKIYAPERVFTRSHIANIILLCFIVFDTISMKYMWNAYLHENKILLWVLCIGIAFCLDLPMSIAASMKKKAKHGITNDQKQANVLLALSLAAFVGLVLLSTWFRLEIAEDLYQKNNASGMTIMTSTETSVPEENVSDRRACLLAALNMAILPAFTSILCYVLTDAVTDPKKDAIVALKLQKVLLEQELLSLHGAIAEIGDLNMFNAEKHAEEDAAHQAFLLMVDAEAASMKALVRTQLMEATATPDAITTLTDSAEHIVSEATLDRSKASSQPQFPNMPYIA